MPADRPRRIDTPDDDRRRWGSRPVVWVPLGAGGLFAVLLETTVMVVLLLARCEAGR